MSLWHRELQPIRAEPHQTSANESGPVCLQSGPVCGGDEGEQAGQSEEEERVEHDLTEAVLSQD